MYQFYYADAEKVTKTAQYQRNVKNEYEIEAVRPTMWEEHCLECSAPVCFHNCAHFLDRGDSRCKRFENGIYVQKNSLGCGGQSARIQFRKWANMMTHLFPAMLTVEQNQKMIDRNQILGNMIGCMVRSPLPNVPKFTLIRTPEFVRRKALRKLKGLDNTPTAFIFHGFSFAQEVYHLFIEIYDDHTPVYKTSLLVAPGENLQIIDASDLSPACWHSNYQVKVYPENDLEVELEILWCDFVRGKRIASEAPAKHVKCVVWDLDNTLWNGVLIETDNEENIQLNPGVMDLIKALDARGIIQSIASKNDYETTWSMIERLGLAEYFLYPQIHWNAKSGSMEQIAKNLNIGIDSLALIDDSVFERNQVKSELPQVRVYDTSEVNKLLEYPEFNVVITEESKNRREMYRAEEKRNQLMQSDNTDTVEFLKKCHLRMEIFSPKTEEEKQRCYELVVRTNQLNMSGVKYTPEEFERVFTRVGHRNFAFSCEDDFGKYGIVGFGQYKVNEGVLVFTEFAMSCRVAGKFVESALFETLLNQSICDVGKFSIKKTKKNSLLRRSLEDIGFTRVLETDDEIEYQLIIGLKNSQIVEAMIRNNSDE